MRFAEEVTAGTDICSLSAFLNYISFDKGTDKLYGREWAILQFGGFLVGSVKYIVTGSTLATCPALNTFEKLVQNLRGYPPSYLLT